MDSFEIMLLIILAGITIFVLWPIRKLFSKPDFIEWITNRKIDKSAIYNKIYKRWCTQNAILKSTQKAWKISSFRAQELEKINEVLVGRLRAANLDYSICEYKDKNRPLTDGVKKRLEQLEENKRQRKTIPIVPVYKNGKNVTLDTQLTEAEV